MLNTNNNLQTQTSNALYNAIMEAGGKDRPPMLAPGNYNPPYKFKWTEKIVPVAEDSSKTTTEGYMENYKNISQDIRNQLDAEAEVVQIIPTGIDNDIYSIVDACKATVNSPPPTYDQEPEMVAEDDALSKEKEIDKLMALISLSFKKMINKGTGYDNQRVVNVAGARENVERECQKPKRVKDAAYHKEKMLLCKQEEVGFQLNAEQDDWKDDTDDEPDDQELEAHYMYMAQIQEVTPDVADNSGPIFDTEPLQKVQHDDNYNVFANDREHPEQPESVNDTYLEEQGITNITIDSLDMSTNGETVDQDDDDLAKELDLLASLIEKLKCEIDDSKNRKKIGIIKQDFN
ncbi:hypothetical protein Tco_1353131 [Tanacetum coccineum]